MLLAAKANEEPVSARKNLKVLMVLTGHEGFGIRTVLLSDLAQGPRYGLSFEVLCLDAGECFHKMVESGVRATALDVNLVIAYPRHPLLFPFIWLGRRRMIRDACRAVTEHLCNTRSDIVYSHNIYTHLICGRAAKRVGCRAVGCFHHDLNRKRLFGVQRVLASLACARALDRIVTITAYAHRTLWGPARRKARLIHNGVDINAIRKSVRHIRKVPGRLVIAGRLIDWKKQHVAIHAVKILSDQNVACKLEILGGPVAETNPYYVRLRKLVADLGLDERVTFKGVVSPPYESMASAVGCISCSTREPFGLVVVESMACGTPTVVANTGATAELVIHNETGLQYEAGQPDSLAEALKRLLSDAELRSRLATTASEDAARRFDISVHMRRLRGLFEVLASPEMSMTKE